MSTVNLSSHLDNMNMISAEDVLRFRKEVFSDDQVSRSEAEALFDLDERINESCQEWTVFLAEAISDHIVLQIEPYGYISQQDGQWLMAMVTRDNKIKSNTELEVLIKALEIAKDAPDSLVDFVLKTVVKAVLSGDGQLLNNDKLTPGVIGAPEVELLRRILYTIAGSQGISISKLEAEILFELNDRTVQSENDKSWSDLFVKAIASHLMAVSGYQSLSREEALRREKWLDEEYKGNVMGFMGKMLGSMGSIMSKNSGGQDDSWAQKNADNEAAAKITEKVDQAETAWLIERIERDQQLHENEKALLRFLKEESPSLHPELQGMLDRIA